MQECEHKELPILDYSKRQINLRKPFVERYGNDENKLPIHRSSSMPLSSLIQHARRNGEQQQWDCELASNWTIRFSLL
jgi:hypothetical protein